MTPVCPVCAEEVVKIVGDEDAEILIIGSVPNEDELHYHKPFSGGTGTIFRRELFRNADIDIATCRLAMLWYHADNKNKDCLEVSMELLEQEMRNKKVIILIGTQVVKQYTALSADKVSGLEITEYMAPELLSNGARVFALVNPNTVFMRGVGELRFGLKSIKRRIEEK